MGKPEITEEMIFGCFAAAQEADSLEGTASSFVDVEEYENKIMYPEFARWAKKVNRPDIARIFARVAGEEGLHAHWLRELYADMGTPERGEDTERAVEVLEQIRNNCDELFDMNPKAVLEKALAVAIRVEEREYQDIYPRFRDQALEKGDSKSAEVYQRVIDSERQHAEWFHAALTDYRQEMGAAATA
jgi:rubrerythrin